jgi:hypothetical protein
LRDELKLCQCGQRHKWGIIRYSEDNVPLYGAYPAENGCRDFRAVEEGNENLPAMTAKDTEELWAATNFLNAQVPTATRIAINQIMQIGKGGDGFFAKLFGVGKGSLMEKQWPEFMGLVLSQLTDVRGAMIREDSKFAHLIAHTDEIVESMRGVVQLSERLETLAQMQSRIMDQLESIEARLSPRGEADNAEKARVFSQITKPLWDEPILTDADES